GSVWARSRWGISWGRSWASTPASAARRRRHHPPERLLDRPPHRPRASRPRPRPPSLGGPVPESEFTHGGHRVACLGVHQSDAPNPLVEAALTDSTPPVGSVDTRAAPASSKAPVREERPGPSSSREPGPELDRPRKRRLALLGAGFLV